MLGRKIFSILSLLALTVLLGACGSEDQSVAVTPVSSIDKETEVTVDDSEIDTQKESATALSVANVGEFMGLVSEGQFISLSSFKSLNGLSSATTVQFYFQKCTGGTADIYDAAEDDGFWGNLWDRMTPELNYGNCNERFTRTASGEYVTRGDDYLSKSEVLAAMKEIVSNGTPVMQMGQAAFSFSYKNVTYTIDLNYPVEINPMMESTRKSDGSTSSSSFIGTYAY